MDAELLFCLSLSLCFVTSFSMLLGFLQGYLRETIVCALFVVLGILGMCYSTIPQSEHRKTTTEEIQIFEYDNVQWGVLPTEPKQAVNLNERFGRIISKDEGVVRQHFSKGLYRKFLYKSIAPTLEIIKLPKYHSKNGLALETIL